MRRRSCVCARAVTNRCDRQIIPPLACAAERNIVVFTCYRQAVILRLLSRAAVANWLPNVRTPQTVEIHNDDDFCKLFNALISAYKFCAFFSLCRQILKKFDQKMGEILDFYIFSGEKNRI